MVLHDITGCQLEEIFSWKTDTAAGLDGWSGRDLSLLSGKACYWVAKMLNRIEKGAKWPETATIARAVFLAKQVDSSWEPTDYRMIKITSAIYRKWATLRLFHLREWVMDWSEENQFTGRPGNAACEAWLATAIDVELAELSGQKI